MGVPFSGLVDTAGTFPGATMVPISPGTCCGPGSKESGAESSPSEGLRDRRSALSASPNLI